MKLNTISPAPGSKKTRTRVGRGASAGQGKTCGRGVKGQRARKGGYHKVGFEGGQMPLQRRLPKIGCSDVCGHGVRRRRHGGRPRGHREGRRQGRRGVGLSPGSGLHTTQA